MQQKTKTKPYVKTKQKSSSDKNAKRKMRGTTNAAEQRSCSFEILPQQTRPIIPLLFDG